MPLARIFITVRCIIQDVHDRVLLLKRSDKETRMVGCWEIPGGHIDFGEDPNNAVIREIYEETGIHIKPPVLLSITSRLNKRREHSICITYLADLKSPAVTLSIEHSEYVWVQPRQAIQHDLTKRTYTIIKNYYKDLLSSE